MVIWCLKQTGKVKKFNKWVPHVLTGNLKNKSSFWSVIFSYSIQLWTISPSDCDVRCKVGFIRWLSMFSSVVGLRRSSKPLPKAKLAHTKKQVMAYVCLSAVSLIQYRFLNPIKTIILKYAQQINRMHWKLQWLQPALVNSKGPVLLRNNVKSDVTLPTLQKLNDFRHLP